VNLTEIREVVLLRGASLLHADTLQEIATLGADGLWRAPDGAVTDGIAVPAQTPRAIVSPSEQRSAHQAQDAAWLAQALVVLRELTASQKELTVDDCWAVVGMPPRTPFLMSRLMVVAAKEGLIEKTGRHIRSVRPINGGRTVRVWRSRVCTLEV
jgi:hypothetical protein